MATGFRFTIQLRPGAQRKHANALPHGPIRVEPDQQPIELDEFLERMVFLVRLLDERVVALPTPGVPVKPERPGLPPTASTVPQRLAEMAHAQR